MKTEFEYRHTSEGISLKLYEINEGLTAKVTSWLGITKEIKREIGSVLISSYPGCCGIRILNNLHIQTDYRGKGFADLLIKEVITTYECTQGSFQATCNHHTPEMNHLLEKNDFKLVEKFDNPNSGNTVFVYSLNLKWQP